MIPVRVGLDWRIVDMAVTGNTLNLNRRRCLRFGACCTRYHSMAQVQVVIDRYSFGYVDRPAYDDVLSAREDIDSAHVRGKERVI